MSKFKQLNSIIPVIASQGAAASTYTINGTVYEADGTTPVEGATVALGALTDTSGADGTYTISDVPTGTSGSMTCTKAGYTWTAISVSAMSGNLTGQNYTNTEYEAKLRLVYGAAEVWPLVDITSGTTITAKVNTARNGTLTGWDLQNTASPVTAESIKAPLSGDSDTGNILTSNGSTGLVDIFNPNVGSLAIWINASRPSNVREYLFWLQANAGNAIWARFEVTTLDRITFKRLAATIDKNVAIDTGYVANTWALFGIRWDTGAGADGEVEFSMNGNRLGAVQTGIGTWNGGALTQAAILSDATPGTDSLHGAGAYFAIKAGSTWSLANFAAMYAAANP